MKIKHFKELDGVRGMAALLVMAFHFFQSGLGNGLPAFITKIAVFGQTGVTLFFVLSGFLITRILFQSKQADNYFASFYMRRFLRIFPLYYLVLILFYFVIPSFDGTEQVPFPLQWPYWFYCQNLALTFKWPQNGPMHFWSLAVEEHFYLLWPLLVYYLSIKQIRIATYVIVAISFIVRVILIANGYGVFFFTLTTVDALALGSLLAVKENTIGAAKREYHKYIFFISFFLTIIVWFFVGAKGWLWVQTIKLPLVAFVYYGFLGWVIAEDGNIVTRKILCGKPFLYTGKISYGLYVYHPFIFHYLAKYFKTGNIALNILLSFSLSYMLASISYYLFERPILSFKKYFEYSFTSNPAHEPSSISQEKYAL